MRINSKVVSDKFDDEVVVVNLENGIYYSLKGSATIIWGGVASGFSRHSILKAFRTLTSDQEDKLSAFIDFLIAENLVAEEANATAIQESLFLSEFTAPEYLKFDDMADLIMIDPIHEADQEKGWPHKPA